MNQVNRFFELQKLIKMNWPLPAVVLSIYNAKNVGKMKIYLS